LRPTYLAIIKVKGNNSLVTCRIESSSKVFVQLDTRFINRSVSLLSRRFFFLLADRKSFSSHHFFASKDSCRSFSPFEIISNYETFQGKRIVASLRSQLLIAILWMSERCRVSYYSREQPKVLMPEIEINPIILE